MTTLIYILLALILLGVLVAIHELGHFLSARLCGIPVKEYSIGFGPAVYITEGENTYYIDADPFDPRDGLVKIKPWDIGVRASLTKDYGKHWSIGILTNIGLRDMLYQYPDVGITGHTHLFSLCLTVGYRF